MQLIADTRNIEPLGLLPIVAAVLLLSLGAYLFVHRDRKDMADSPWFWAFVFSAVGLLGVWAISKKYDDREKRLEARYLARQRIAEERVHHDPASSAHEAAKDNDSAGSRSGEGTETLSGYAAQRQVPLRFLAGGLLVVSLGSAIMLWRTASRPPDE